jgi:hypothetical protein
MDSRWKDQAEKYATEQGSDCVHIPGGVGECIYIHSGCQLSKAFQAGASHGYEAALEDAAKIVEDTTYVCMNCDESYYHVGSLHKIRALAGKDSAK